MRNNRQAIIRYKAIDKCLADCQEHDIEQLLDAVNQALKDDGFEPITRIGSVCDAVREMSSLWDDDYPRIKKKKIGRKTYYFYSSPLDAIWTENIDPEILRLRDILSVMRHSTGLQELPWLEDYLIRLKLDAPNPDIRTAIIYQSNKKYTGHNYLKTLFEYIVRRRPVRIGYQTFKDDQGQHHVVHPQVLKEYNQRWFLFAIDDKSHTICNMALDRITSISEVVDIDYIDSNFDFEAYFDSRIGVSGKIDSVPLTLVLKFSDERIKYVLTKPLHHSQRDLGNNTVSVHIAYNPEMLTLIKSFGTDVEVLKPDWLREKLAEEYDKLTKLYSK